MGSILRAAWPCLNRTLPVIIQQLRIEDFQSHLCFALRVASQFCFHRISIRSNLNLEGFRLHMLLFLESKLENRTSYQYLCETHSFLTNEGIKYNAFSYYNSEIIVINFVQAPTVYWSG